MIIAHWSFSLPHVRPLLVAFRKHLAQLPSFLNHTWGECFHESALLRGVTVQADVALGESPAVGWGQGWGTGARWPWRGLCPGV